MEQFEFRAKSVIYYGNKSEWWWWVSLLDKTVMQTYFLLIISESENQHVGNCQIESNFPIYFLYKFEFYFLATC